MNNSTSESLSKATLISYIEFLRVSNPETLDAFVNLIKDFDLELRNSPDSSSFIALTNEFVSLILAR